MTLYSSLKFLHYPEQLHSLTDKTVVAPVHIRVKPINHCNHNCWYCSYRTDFISLGAEMVEQDVMPEEKMISLAHEFVELGIKAVTFSGGGEPMLYKALPEVIKILSDGGVSVASLTNGSALKGRMADAFADNATWVRVSVDAWDDSSYVKSRGAKPGDFSRLLVNMREFASRKSKCVLGVSFIVGRDNHTHITEVCELFKECGVDHVKVTAAVVANQPSGNDLYHHPFKDEALKQIHEAQSPSFKVLDHYSSLSQRFEKAYHTCPSLRFLTVIGADQCVYTCQDKAYTTSGRMGSIKDRTFKDFWFSTENQKFLNTFDPVVECKHHCVSHAKNVAINEYLSLDEEHINFV